MTFANMPCSHPRCPNNAGRFYYCDVHRTPERETDAIEDHARAVLADWRESALQNLLATEPQSEEPELEWKLKEQRIFARSQLQRMDMLDDAIRRGENWPAVMHALTIGLLEGLRQGNPEPIMLSGEHSGSNPTRSSEKRSDTRILAAARRA